MNRSIYNESETTEEISRIYFPDELDEFGCLQSDSLTRPKAISRACDSFIETEEDIEEIEYLLSFFEGRRISGASATPSTADTDVSLPIPSHTLQCGRTQLPTDHMSRIAESEEEANQRHDQSQEGKLLRKRDRSEEQDDLVKYKLFINSLALRVRTKTDTLTGHPVLLQKVGMNTF